MGISNQIPNSRIAQAGVIPDTANRPASPYEGQMLYQKDTNQVLVYDGSAWVAIADTDQPPGMQLIKSQTISSGASQQVTGAFGSDYDHYRIGISNLVVSTDMQIRLTFGSTNTGYYYGNPLATMSGGAYDFNTGTNTSYIDLGVARSAAANDFGFDVFAPYNTRPTKVSGFGYINSITFGGLGSGYLNNSTSYSEFTLTASTGTLTSGTIRVYGYRN